MVKKSQLHLVETDARSRAQLARLAYNAGFHCEIYEDVQELLSNVPAGGIVLFHDRGQRSALPELIRQLALAGHWCPFIGFCDNPSVDLVVQAMRGGALSFIGTPTDASGLADAIAPIAFEAERRREVLQRAVEAYRSLMRLTERERQVLDGIVSGESSKAIARELEISPRTVEIHRSKLLGKLGARNAADAVRLKVEAAAYTALAA